MIGPMGERPVVIGGDVAVWFGELDEPHTECQRRVRAVDPELVWHEHETWRPRTVQLEPEDPPAGSCAASTICIDLVSPLNDHGSIRIESRIERNSSRSSDGDPGDRPDAIIRRVPSTSRIQNSSW